MIQKTFPGDMDDESLQESLSEEELECTHCGVSLGDSFLECGKCKHFRFCSERCSDILSEMHADVCYDIDNTDPMHLATQLENVYETLDSEDLSYCMDLHEALHESEVDSEDIVAAQELIEQEYFDRIEKKGRRWKLRRSGSRRLKQANRKGRRARSRERRRAKRAGSAEARRKKRAVKKDARSRSRSLSRERRAASRGRSKELRAQKTMKRKSKQFDRKEMRKANRSKSKEKRAIRKGQFKEKRAQRRMKRKSKQFDQKARRKSRSKGRNRSKDKSRSKERGRSRSKEKERGLFRSREGGRSPLRGGGFFNRTYAPQINVVRGGGGAQVPAPLPQQDMYYNRNQGGAPAPQVPAAPQQDVYYGRNQQGAPPQDSYYQRRLLDEERALLEKDKLYRREPDSLNRERETDSSDMEEASFNNRPAERALLEKDKLYRREPDSLNREREADASDMEEDSLPLNNRPALANASIDKDWW